MAKKNKKQPETPQAPVVEDGITSSGKKVIAGGAVLLLGGFIVLSFTDAMGRNWASQLSPFLILAGYGVIAAGIFFPEKTT